MSNEQQQFEPQTSGDQGQELADGFAYGDGTFVTEENKGAGRNRMILLGGLLVAVAFAGVMYLRGPSKVEAAGGPNQADETVSSFLSDGGENIQQMQRMLQDTERVVEQFLTYPSVTQVPVDDLQANPFRFRTGEEGPADAGKEQEQLRLAALKAVQELSLQSIMHGDVRRACMINNTVYQEGQQVNGFTVRTIQPASVIVQRDQYRFELKMKH